MAENCRSGWCSGPVWNCNCRLCVWVCAHKGMQHVWRNDVPSHWDWMLIRPILHRETAKEKLWVVGRQRDFWYFKGIFLFHFVLLNKARKRCETLFWTSILAIIKGKSLIFLFQSCFFMTNFSGQLKERQSNKKNRKTSLQCDPPTHPLPAHCTTSSSCCSFLSPRSLLQPSHSNPRRSAALTEKAGDTNTCHISSPRSQLFLSSVVPLGGEGRVLSGAGSVLSVGLAVFFPACLWTHQMYIAHAPPPRSGCTHLHHTPLPPPTPLQLPSSTHCQRSVRVPPHHRAQKRTRTINKQHNMTH